MMFSLLRIPPAAKRDGAGLETELEGLILNSKTPKLTHPAPGGRLPISRSENPNLGRKKVLPRPRTKRKAPFKSQRKERIIKRRTCYSSGYLSQLIELEKEGFYFLSPLCCHHRCCRCHPIPTVQHTTVITVPIHNTNFPP